MISINEVEVLAKTIWGEARGEDLAGMIAVGWTVKNRTLRRPWPDTYLKVCLQPWQFSVWNKTDANYPRLILGPADSNEFQIAMFVALGVTLGLIPDPTHGSDHYHHKRLDPFWAEEMAKTIEIGDHVFYNSEL